MASDKQRIIQPTELIQFHFAAPKKLPLFSLSARFFRFKFGQKNGQRTLDDTRGRMMRVKKNHLCPIIHLFFFSTLKFNFHAKKRIDLSPVSGFGSLRSVPYSTHLIFMGSSRKAESAEKMHKVFAC